MKRIPITLFKAQCSRFLEQVQRTKKPICITRRGSPVAEIVPVTIVTDRTSWIGSMKNSIKIFGDIVSPASDEDEWEVISNPDRVLDPCRQNRKS